MTLQEARVILDTARNGGLVPFERLREVLSYEPITGEFRWRASLGRRPVKAGDVAGFLRNGYWTIGLDDRDYPAHRLAWLYVYGVWPTGQIDHMNGKRTDNRLANLRDVTGAINSQNQRRPRIDNTTGLLGVGYDKRRKKFRAQIQTNGVNRFLGRFSTAEEAHAVYLAAKRSAHEGCTL